MAKSLLEQLPEIVKEGRKQAERILESLENRQRVTLQTREVVLPAKDSAAQDWIRAQTRQQQREVFAPGQTSLLESTQPMLDDANAGTSAPLASSSGPAWTNRLIYGDNLLAMAALLAGDEQTPSLRGKVDLIYIDPPFDSKADYRTKVNLPGLELEQKPTVIEQFAYSDTWSDGTASYLAMITPRLILMRELLANTGSIYVHLDWHVGHYVKLVLDEVFGKDNFQNEIIWKRIYSHSDADRFGIVHDTLLFYAKGNAKTFKRQFRPHSADYIKSHYGQVDEEGRRFRLVTLTGAGPGPARKFEDRTISPPSGRHWAWSQERIDQGLLSGKIVFANTGQPNIKQFLDETPGTAIPSIWDDIFPVNPIAVESIDYATQKPEALIERVINASCPADGLVADFNGGSGTTAAMAEKLGRRWITTDLGKPACMIMRKRLIDLEAKPFLYQAIGDYQVEAAKATLGRDFRMGDLSQIVLSLYGALPLPADVNPQRNLGQISTLQMGAPSPQPSPGGRGGNSRGGSKTLVLADSPNKLTGAATLRKAQAQRDNLLGGWDRVVVLGWNFEPSIGETITALNDDRLEVLVIPPDLMDRLKKKGGIDKLRGQVRFSSLQYLTIHSIERRASAPASTPARAPALTPALSQGEREPNPGTTTPQETLTIRLKNYVLLSPEAINLDEGNRIKLQTVANREPLALIEYWAVDPDYDGKVFRSVWQDYRGNTARDADPLRVVTQATLTTPAKPGPRKVCVRVVDVFGFEAEVISTVEKI